MAIKQVPLSDLKFDVRLQCRATMDQSVIEDYRDIFLTAKHNVWPFKEPMEAVEVGGVLYVTNGFTRGNAAMSAGRKLVNVNVIKGDWEVAVRLACKANATQGQRRTNADKKRAVLIALRELASLSVQQIADACEVSRAFVSSVRAKEHIAPPAVVSGADGKQYPAAIEQPKQGSVIPDPEPPAPAPVPAPKPKPKPEEHVPLAFQGPLEKACPACGENDWAETKDGTLCVGCLEPYPDDPKPATSIDVETLSSGLVSLPPIPEAAHKELQSAFGRLHRRIEALKREHGVPAAHFGDLMDQLFAAIHELPVEVAEAVES